MATPVVVKVLRERPACSNSDIESQLLEAAKNGEIEVVKVEYVATFIFLKLPRPFTHNFYALPGPLQRLCTPRNVNCRDMQGRFSTPVHFAAGYNRVDVVEYLLQQNADVTAKDKGCVVAHYSCNSTQLYTHLCACGIYNVYIIWWQNMVLRLCTSGMVLMGDENVCFSITYAILHT